MLKIIIFKSKKNKKWYVKLVSTKNGKKVWSNVQGYERIAGALNSVKLLSKIKYPAEKI